MISGLFSGTDNAIQVKSVKDKKRHQNKIYRVFTLIFSSIFWILIKVVAKLNFTG